MKSKLLSVASRNIPLRDNHVAADAPLSDKPISFRAVLSGKAG